jgi:hypothetical protein
MSACPFCATGREHPAFATLLGDVRKQSMEESDPRRWTPSGGWFVHNQPLAHLRMHNRRNGPKRTRSVAPFHHHLVIVCGFRATRHADLFLSLIRAHCRTATARLVDGIALAQVLHLACGGEPLQIVVDAGSKDAILRSFFADQAQRTQPQRVRRLSRMLYKAHQSITSASSL